MENIDPPSHIRHRPFWLWRDGDTMARQDVEHRTPNIGWKREWRM